ncbi:hypothetical protein BH23DEI1_BH23DEI1_24870 [soil metagenome]
MTAPVLTRAEALARIEARTAELRSMGVASLQLFGSAGRDELTRSSDVDVLVDFERPVGTPSWMFATSWRTCLGASSTW